jgi:hypothetical protein
MRVGPTYRTFAFLLAGALLSGDAHSQTTTSGGLAGVVIDQTTAVVPDAAVEIKDVAKGTTQSGRTDKEGVYQFPLLRPATYTLRVTHPGFQEERRSVNVQVGPPATVNITLQVATASSEITIIDEAPIIQAETGDVSTTINQKQISEVPNPGNDLTYIVQTTPGVVMNTDVPNAPGMNFSILGMPSTSYLYSIDGVDNPPTGVLGLLLGQKRYRKQPSSARAIQGSLAMLRAGTSIT